MHSVQTGETALECVCLRSRPPRRQAQRADGLRAARAAREAGQGAHAARSGRELQQGTPELVAVCAPCGLLGLSVGGAPCSNVPGLFGSAPLSQQNQTSSAHTAMGRQGKTG
jgi:hypothetical protein